MPEQKPVELGLLITDKRDRDHYRIVLHAVVLGTETDAAGHARPDSVRNASDDPHRHPIKGGWYLKDFVVSCLGVNEARQDPPHLFAFEARFENVYSIDVRTATSMAKTLTRVDKGLEKLNAKRGYARTYGEFCQRVAEVLGVTRFVRQQGAEGHGWGHDANDYRFMDLGEGRDFIEGIERAWTQSLEPKAASA